MATDIFDTLAAPAQPSGDVFDHVAANPVKGDIFDSLHAGSQATPRDVQAQRAQQTAPTFAPGRSFVNAALREPAAKVIKLFDPEQGNLIEHENAVENPTAPTVANAVGGFAGNVTRQGTEYAVGGPGLMAVDAGVQGAGQSRGETAMRRDAGEEISGAQEAGRATASGATDAAAAYGAGKLLGAKGVGFVPKVIGAGGISGAQQAAHNVIEDRPIGEGVAKSAAIGAGTYAVMHGINAAFDTWWNGMKTGQQAPPETAPPPEMPKDEGVKFNRGAPQPEPQAEQPRQAPPRTSAPDDPHVVLGLDPNGDIYEEDVKAAARKAYMRTHPDVGGDPAEFQRVKAAADALMNKYGGKTRPVAAAAEGDIFDRIKPETQAGASEGAAAADTSEAANAQQRANGEDIFDRVSAAGSSIPTEQGTSVVPSPPLRESSQSQPPTAGDTSTPSAAIGEEQRGPTLSNRASQSAPSSGVIPQEENAAIGKSLTGDVFDKLAPEMKPERAPVRNVGEGSMNDLKALAEKYGFDPDEPRAKIVENLRGMEHKMRKQGVIGADQSLLDEATGEGATPSEPPAGARQRKGAVYLPVEEAKRGLGVIRRLRERFSEIEAKDGPDLAKALINRVTTSDQAKTLVGNFTKKAFAGSPDPKQSLTDFLTLGYDFRRELLNMRGQPASNLPKLSAAERARLMADPYIKNAIAVWNRELRPLIDDIRTRNRMPMDPNASKVPFFLNLVTESDPSTGGQSATTYGKAFSKPASGEGEYTNDPDEALTRILGGHLRSDASADISAAVKRISIDPLKVVDPLGKRIPAAFQQAKLGTPFEATVKGRKEKVGVVDLNEGKTGAGGNPLPPDLHYVPERVAKEINNIKQPRGDYDTIIDKVIRGFTRVGLIGDFAPHAVRVLANTSARLAQAGYSPASLLPSWLGSIPRTIARMRQMANHQIGEVMQIIVDRSGASRGAGFGVKEATTRLGKILNIPHDALMSPDHGVDPMARRVVADAHLRMLLGNTFMDKLEADVAGGRITPVEAARGIEKHIDPDEFTAIGRRVNATLGFFQRQTRSELLNWVQRIFPFAGSESGMIPDEIRRTLTGNINPPAIARNINRGAYGRALLQVATMLAGGAVGIHLLKQSLNYGTTKLATGKGRFMDQNDEGHKDDVMIAKGWYWTNLDPGIQRAERILGIRSLLNKEQPHVGIEVANEGMSTLASSLRVAFSLLTGKEAYITSDGKLMDARMPWPTGIGRRTVDAAQRDKSVKSGVLQDAASLAGVQLRESSGKNYSDAERFLHQAMVEKMSGFDSKAEDKQKRLARETLIQSIREQPGKTTSLLDAAQKQGVIIQQQRTSIAREAKEDQLQRMVRNSTVEDATAAWEKMSDDEKKRAADLVRFKIAGAEKLNDEQKADLFRRLGLPEVDRTEKRRHNHEMQRERRDVR